MVPREQQLNHTIVVYNKKKIVLFPRWMTHKKVREIFIHVFIREFF